MRTILGALIWVFVGVGAISAVTAYFVPTTLDPEAYRSASEPDTPGKAGPGGYLLTSSPAGPLVPRDGGEAPQFPAGTELTPDVIAQMSAPTGPDGAPLVDRVHVGEFGFARWSHKWWFTGSVVLLALCGLGQRALAGGQTLKKGMPHPVEALDAAVSEVRAVRASIAGLPNDEARLDAIVERIGELQQTHMAAVPEGRETITAKLGLAGYANVMDAFAGGERKINRAWSAAADGDLGEAIDSLDEGLPLLEEAQRRLGTA